VQETALWDLLARYRGHVHQIVKVSGEITSCVGGLQGPTTIVRNETALITQDFGRQVKGSGFDGTKSDDAKTVPGVLGYMDSGTGDKFMLVVHQAIF